MPTPLARTALSVSGAVAEIAPDGFSESGRVLRIGGVEQSHVDLADPATVRHEYLRRIASVLDTAAPAGAPLSVLHLGAGALTLARYVQATRPGSGQVAVEIEPELVALVLEALPLPAGTDLDVRIGDAAERLEALGDARFDAIVLDVFSGVDSPAHLARAAFYAEALARLAERGVLAVNVGDDAGLELWAGQALELLDAADEAGCPGAWTLTDSTLLDLESEGNLVLVAGPGVSPAVRPEDELESIAERWLAAGPHPAAVLDPEETEDLAERVHG